LAHYYGCENTTVPGDLFSSIWNGPSEQYQSLYLEDVFVNTPEVLENLLIDERDENSWRTPHVLIAEEVLFSCLLVFLFFFFFFFFFLGILLLFNFL